MSLLKILVYTTKTEYFFARYQHMINDDLSKKKKKITTFSGKAFSSELP